MTKPDKKATRKRGKADFVVARVSGVSGEKGSDGSEKERELKERNA